MSNRDPHDPDGEYEGHAQQYDSDDEFSRERIAKIFSDYKDTCTREDCYCAQEGWSQVETQEDTFANRAEGWEVSADITTLGDDTCAGEFARETVTQQAIALILEREKMGTRTYGKPLFADAKSFLAWADDAIDEAADQLQYLIAMREALATYLDSV